MIVLLRTRHAPSHAPRRKRTCCAHLMAHVVGKAIVMLGTTNLAQRATRLGSGRGWFVGCTPPSCRIPHGRPLTASRSGNPLAGCADTLPSARLACGLRPCWLDASPLNRVARARSAPGRRGKPPTKRPVLGHLYRVGAILVKWLPPSSICPLWSGRS